MGMMGIFYTVSEINGDFSRQSQIFHIFVYLTPLPKGFPLEFRIGAKGQKLRVLGLSYVWKKVGLAVQTQYRRVTDKHPDGHATIAKVALNA